MFKIQIQKQQQLNLKIKLNEKKTTDLMNQ